MRTLTNVEMNSLNGGGSDCSSWLDAAMAFMMVGQPELAAIAMVGYAGCQSAET